MLQLDVNKQIVMKIKEIIAILASNNLFILYIMYIYFYKVVIMDTLIMVLCVNNVRINV